MSAARLTRNPFGRQISSMAPHQSPYFFALDKIHQLWYDVLSYLKRFIMPTTKVAVTIDTELLAQVDHLVAQHVFPNRSKAIQAALHDKLTRLQRSRLARESAKLDPHTEQLLAEEGMDQELATWPEY
jgi:Arc/MetJ-type ribon-helix-helix transcriptional regulator